MKFYFEVAIIMFVNVLGDQWGTNNRVALMRDMSKTCINNLQDDIYLPFGMGAADAIIIIVSDTEVYANCNITFYSEGQSKGVYLILVVEFPDKTEGTENACQDINSRIYVSSSDPTQRFTDVCAEVNMLKLRDFETAVWRKLFDTSNVSVVISSKSLFETVKITVTAARKLGHKDQCKKNDETKCSIDDSTVCISKEFLCDGNINCGQTLLYDEDVRVCDEGRYKRLWLAVTCGIIMVLIIVFFLIHGLRMCVADVADNFFIFNEDEDNKLILSSTFNTAPEHLRQQIEPRLKLASTSSFTFHDIPLNNSTIQASKRPSIIHKQTEEGDRVERNLDRAIEELEAEIISQIYSKSVNKERNNKEKYMSLKPKSRPRFNSDTESTSKYVGPHRPSSNLEETSFATQQYGADVPQRSRKTSPLKK